MAYRILYRFYRMFSSTHYWVRRRFTPAGLALLAGTVIIGLMGIDTTQDVAHQAFSFLASLLLLAMAASVSFRGRFNAERILPRVGSVGMALPYRVAVHNQTRQTQRGLVLLENLGDPRPTLAEFTAQFKAEDAETTSFSITRRATRKPRRTLARVTARPVPTLPPRGSGELKMELIPVHRGILRFEGLTVARPDPIGLFQSFHAIPQKQTVLILPRRYFLPALALPGFNKYQPGGVAQASSVGASEEFMSMREYRPGDPLRRIHWKSWAKAGKPVIKEFQDEFFVRHALVLDTFADRPDSEAFEEAVSVAASFACAIQTQESLLDLLFVGPQAFCFTAGRSLAHTEQMLEILAAVRACQEKPFDELERLVVEHSGDVSGCVVILLSWDEPRRRLIHKLQTLGVPLLVAIVTTPAGAAEIKAAADATRLARFHILETGKIAEGLAKL